MEKDKIVMLRVVGGEFIIGKIDNVVVVDENSNIQSESKNKIKLTDARGFIVTSRGIAFMPIFPYTQTESHINTLSKIEVDKSIVLKEIDETYIDGEIINAYKSSVSGIDMSASNKGIII